MNKKQDNPDDSIKKLENDHGEEPEIFKVSKKAKLIDRKDFIKTAGQVAGMAALGSLIVGCEESEYDISGGSYACHCHAVCTCNSESEDDDEEHTNVGNQYESKEIDGSCTCDTVCTCNSVCSCDAVCTCNTEPSSSCSSCSSCGSYWYPC